MLCPKCGHSFDPGWHLPALDKARRFFGTDYPRVTAYLDLFRRAPEAAMNLSKRLRLLRETAKVLQDGGYSYERSRYCVERPEALACMDLAVQTLSKGLRPGAGLKNHNYWKQVMRSRGAEMLADRRERECRDKEDLARSRPRHAGPEQGAPVGAQLVAPSSAPALNVLKSMDAPPPGEEDRIRSAYRDILHAIRIGDHRPEIVARICRKYNVDPHKVHQWMDAHGGEDNE